MYLLESSFFFCKIAILKKICITLIQVFWEQYGHCSSANKSVERWDRDVDGQLFSHLPVLYIHQINCRALLWFDFEHTNFSIVADASLAR